MMGKIKEFKIVFSNTAGVFHAGDNLTGHVYLNIKEPMNMQSIKLHLFGKAKVHWTKKNGKDTTHYRGEEIYFNNTLILRQGHGNQKFELSAGIHNYPFQYPLGSQVPSSFEGTLGYIRYTSKATLVRPWKFDQDTKRAFTIIQPADLNYSPSLATPVEGHKETQQELCCCSYGNVTLHVRVAKKGVVPGECIGINAQIINGSTASVTSSKAILTQKVSYKGKSDNLFSSGHLKAKSLEKVISNKSKGVCAPGTTQIWEENMLVPSLPPSQLIGCNILDVSYRLEFVVSPSYANKMKIGTEIVIGTIPIRTGVQAVNLSPFHLSVAPPPPEAGVSASAPPSYDVVMATAPPLEPITIQPSAPREDIPPPSYEQCALGGVDIHDEGDSGHTMGDMNYNPVYTYYNWASHNQQTFGASQPPAMPDCAPGSAPPSQQEINRL